MKALTTIISQFRTDLSCRHPHGWQWGQERIPYRSTGAKPPGRFRRQVAPPHRHTHHQDHHLCVCVCVCVFIPGRGAAWGARFDLKKKPNHEYEDPIDLIYKRCNNKNNNNSKKAPKGSQGIWRSTDEPREISQKSFHPHPVLDLNAHPSHLIRTYHHFCVP